MYNVQREYYTQCNLQILLFMIKMTYLGEMQRIAFSAVVIVGVCVYVCLSVCIPHWWTAGGRF